MADRHSPPPRQSGESGRRAPLRRNDVIRCANCGEDYSVTYKRCPFCDERPGRGGSRGGKRVANTRGGGYGGPVNPIQVVWLVISFLLIIAALFIVFRFFGSSIFEGKGGGGSSSQGSSSTSQSGNTSAPGGSSAIQPGGSSSAGPGDSSTGDQSQPVELKPQSITLVRDALTLRYGEVFTMQATVLPEGVTEPIVWSSSLPEVAPIDEYGNLTNRNKGNQRVRVTITATCGDVSVEGIMYCRYESEDTGAGTTEPQPPEPQQPEAPSNSNNTTPVAPNTRGTIVNAGSGLNIRSGPGKDYDRVASTSNGVKVTILGEENGWYKIAYNGSNTGYVSKDYVSIG